MITKTRGIVINYIKFQENSIIVKIYTRDHGLISVIVNGIRSARSKRSLGFFQSFSILEIVIYLKQDRAIQRLSEYRFGKQTPEISANIYKTTVALFLSEVLSKVLIGEENQQEALYEFIEQAIITLNELKDNVENFHIQFLLELSAYLGFGIEKVDDLLNSMELEFLTHQKEVFKFLEITFNGDLANLKMYSGAIRTESLKLILTYYRHHGIHIGEIKSLKVLQQVFN